MIFHRRAKVPKVNLRLPSGEVGSLSVRLCAKSHRMKYQYLMDFQDKIHYQPLQIRIWLVFELARVVDRGIRESGTVDMSKLVIKKDVSVVGVFADNSVVDHDGNLFDACSYASTCAILSSKMPKWEMVDDRPKIVEGAEGPTPVQTIPVSITMARIKDHILVDPNGDEWESMDARVTISTNSDENICAMQKGGTGGFTQKQLEDCAELSIKKGALVRDMIRKATNRSDL